LLGSLMPLLLQFQEMQSAFGARLAGANTSGN